MNLNAGGLSRRLDATDRYSSVPGMRRACRIGFSFYPGISRRRQEEHESTNEIVQVTLPQRQLAEPPLDVEHVGENRRSRWRELHAR